MSIVGFPGFTRPRGNARPDVLAVTPDDRLYCSLLYVSTQYGWVTRWAKSVARAVEVLQPGMNSILLYDWYSESDSWRSSTDRLLRADNAACIVLAAPKVDEDLWQQALRYRLYDVVSRQGPACLLAATLRFAWQRKVQSQGLMESAHGMVVRY
jgi:hypothetical protein